MRCTDGMRIGLLLVLLAFFAACASSEPFAPKPPADKGIAPRHAAAWTALRGLQLEKVEASSPSPEIRDFAAALSLILRGDLEAAICRLAHLWSRGQDPEVRRQAVLLLANILSSPLIREWVEPTGERLDIPIEGATVPLTFNRTRIPLVEVKVGGRFRRLCLDTGATITAMGFDVAKRMNLDPSALEEIPAQNIMGQALRVKMGVIDRLEIGGCVIHGLRVGFLPQHSFLYRYGRVAKFVYDAGGALGWNAFHSLCISIDRRSRSMILRPSVGRNADSPNLLWLGYPVVIGRSLGGRRLLFGLDTGSSHSTVTPALLEKLPRVQGTYVNVKIWGVGGFSMFRTFCLEELAVDLGGVRLHLRDLVSLPLDFGTFVRLDGILGMDAIEEMAMRFDLPAGRFELLPRSLPSAAQLTKKGSGL